MIRSYTSFLTSIFNHQSAIINTFPDTSRLLPLELRHALLLVRRDAFLGVLALEQELLQLPFDRQRRLRREVPTGLHRALDAAHGLRCLVRRDELAGVVHDLLPPLLRRGVDDLVDQAE